MPHRILAILTALALSAGPTAAAETVTVRSAATDAAPAPFETVRIMDLGHEGEFVDYVAERDQGTRRVTDGGTSWWGWGLAGGPPRPAIVLFHGSGRTGESMVDMWREVAERASVVLVAPDFEGVEGWDRGLPDPRVMLDALNDAARH